MSKHRLACSDGFFQNVSLYLGDDNIINSPRSLYRPDHFQVIEEVVTGNSATLVVEDKVEETLHMVKLTAEPLSCSVYINADWVKTWYDNMILDYVIAFLKHKLPFIHIWIE